MLSKLITHAMIHSTQQQIISNFVNNQMINKNTLHLLPFPDAQIYNLLKRLATATNQPSTARSLSTQTTNITTTTTLQ